MVDEYFCVKCGKNHPINYYKHRKYSFDNKEELKIEIDLEAVRTTEESLLYRLILLETRVGYLSNTVDDMLEILKKWHSYMVRHVHGYNSTPEVLR